MSPRPLGLFQAVGVEIEYMIVCADTMAVLPAADKVLEAAAGEIVSEVEMGTLSWSNELCLHVLELKTNGPAAGLGGLARAFAADAARADAMLRPLGGRLMPGGAHPFMDPARETRLWPHEYSPVYEAFNRIFHCQGHGWSNLQSVHLNLPFANDEEFGRLHAAIRLVLPFLPALAASTPILGARPTGLMDSRMQVYRDNARRVPQVTGRVIPEPAFSRADYERMILEPLYAAIRPLDPEGVLSHEWLNARGAIARFERDAIEIRVLDAQECPSADVAVAHLVIETLKALCAERFTDLASQKAWPVAPLAEQLGRCVKDADQAPVTDPDLARALGFQGPLPCMAGDVWRNLAEHLPAPPDDTAKALDVILGQGCLARRLMRALGQAPNRTPAQTLDRTAIVRACRALCRCLESDQPFTGLEG